MKMRSTFSLVVLLGMGSGPAIAEELAPLQAGTYRLGDHTASVYYVIDKDSYQVVTTVAPNPGVAGGPVRFEGSLALGEKQVVSVGTFDSTAPPVVLEIIRDGDVLTANVVIQEAALPKTDRLAAR